MVVAKIARHLLSTMLPRMNAELRYGSRTAASHEALPNGAEHGKKGFSRAETGNCNRESLDSACQ